MLIYNSIAYRKFYIHVSDNGVNSFFLRKILMVNLTITYYSNEYVNIFLLTIEWYINKIFFKIIIKIALTNIVYLQKF